MAKSQAIISGSLALQLFERTSFQNTDMDIFLPSNYHKTLSPLEHHLIQNENYTSDIPPPSKPNSDNIDNTDDTNTNNDTDTDDDTDDDSTVDANAHQQPQPNREYSDETIITTRKYIRKYTRHDDEKNNEKKIDIIICQYTPQQTIVKFHSTIVMNAITHEKAYCLYPNLMRSKQSIRNAPHVKRHKKIIQKYESRGYKFYYRRTSRLVNYTYPTDPVKAFIRRRCWSDKHVQTIDLEPLNYEAIHTYFDDNLCFKLTKQFTYISTTIQNQDYNSDDNDQYTENDDSQPAQTRTIIQFWKIGKVISCSRLANRIKQNMY